MPVAVTTTIMRSIFTLLMAMFLLADPAGAEDRFEMTFKPAFHPSSTIRMVRADGTTTLTFVYGDLRTRERKTEEFLLGRKVADQFFSRMDELTAKWSWTLNIIVCLRITFYDGISFGPSVYSIVDGFSVEGSYVTGDNPPFHFASRNPSKRIPHKPRDYDITLAVFEVIDSLDMLKPTLSLTEYTEQISTYIGDRPFPAKIMGGDPFRVRLYGVMYSKDDKDLKNLIDRLPTDKPLVIDMSNLEGMATTLYPRFQELLRKNPDIKWISTKEAKRRLLEIGVPEGMIEAIPTETEVR